MPAAMSGCRARLNLGNELEAETHDHVDIGYQGSGYQLEDAEGEGYFTDACISDASIAGVGVQDTIIAGSTDANTHDIADTDHIEALDHTLMAELHSVRVGLEAADIALAQLQCHRQQAENTAVGSLTAAVLAVAEAKMQTISAMFDKHGKAYSQHTPDAGIGQR